MEGKKVHLKTQDKLKARNLHDLEHYDRRERLSLVWFNLFLLHEIYTNNNNKTKYKNQYLEQNKHILRYIIGYQAA